MLYHGLLQHFAVAVSAVSGVLAGSGKRVDLFGVVVLGLVTALGGGTLRDVVLDAPHVFWIKDPAYVLNAAGTALVTFVIARYWSLPAKGLAVADAFGLALFTTLGAAKGLHYHVGAVNAVVMGLITGVAGGIARDTLVGEIPLVFRREIHLYATAAICGATVFILMRQHASLASASMLAGTAATLALRLAGIFWRLSLPLFRAKPPPPDA
ncbi:MAG: trimeric intracellular cation channel family protein [Verrucomicrobia bacterium]|nr:trimeric intracellular cation channel family protein [Verrucomicrobiota bacterium]